MNTTAEFLRRLADLIDLADKDRDNKAAAVAPVPDDTGVMIPPLQQNIELMKKMAGVESAYDENTANANVSASDTNSVITSEPNNDVDILKRNVGIIDAINASTPSGG
jgi:hypothetical protein